MSVQQQSLIDHRGKHHPIRILLADDSDVIRRVISGFLEQEPSVEIVGEARNFAELLQKVPDLKPRVVLMDVHMRDESEFNPDVIKANLHASSATVLAMSICVDDETAELSSSYGASLLLDKNNLVDDLLPTIGRLCA